MIQKSPQILPLVKWFHAVSICKLFLLTSLIFQSCNNFGDSSSKTSGLQDTLQEPTYQLQDTSPSELKTTDSSFINKKDSTSNIKGEQTRESKPKSLYLTESSIVFDADFNPSLLAKVTNYLNETVVAFEILIKPSQYNNSNCKAIYRKIKISISSGKSAIIKRSLKEEFQSDCFQAEIPNIIIGDIILISGKKVKAPSFFDQFDAIPDPLNKK